MSPRIGGSPTPRMSPRQSSRTGRASRSALSRIDQPHQAHNTSVRPFPIRDTTPACTPTAAQPLTQSLRTTEDDRARGPPSASLQTQGLVTPSPAPRNEASQSRREDSSCWVTVFGFPECEKEKTLQEFRRLGGVLREVYDGYNFVHIQYAIPDLARRALEMNCRRHHGFDGRPFMIGVTECTEQDVAANQAVMPAPIPSQMAQAYAYNNPAQFRNYQLESNQDTRVAVQEPTLLTKLGSFIFGA